jgi:hypothetical protein
MQDKCIMQSLVRISTLVPVVPFTMNGPHGRHQLRTLKRRLKFMLSLKRMVRKYLLINISIVIFKGVFEVGQVVEATPNLLF